MKPLIAELRALLDKATPGPWGFAPGVRHSYWHRNIFASGRLPLAHVASTKNAGLAGDADTNAALIAAAVNNLPALLTALEAKDAEIARLRGEVIEECAKVADKEVASANQVRGATATYIAAAIRARAALGEG